ncbi:hypothetical protein DENSPDRAFT_320540 [Dentipellis sp. KUC8613]|nr:hypothetical protein DENSPDRAFT_320540 [Dentipellis sp. KUC8613]
MSQLQLAKPGPSLPAHPPTAKQMPSSHVTIPADIVVSFGSATTPSSGHDFGRGITARSEPGRDDINARVVGARRRLALRLGIWNHGGGRQDAVGETLTSNAGPSPVLDSPLHHPAVTIPHGGITLRSRIWRDSAGMDEVRRAQWCVGVLARLLHSLWFVVIWSAAPAGSAYTYASGGWSGVVQIRSRRRHVLRPPRAVHY